MSRLRIAHVLYGCAGGGVSRAINDLGAGLDRARFDASFFFLTEGGWLGERLRQLGHGVLDLRGRTGYSLFARFRLINALSRFEPDVIHCHDLPPTTEVVIRLGLPRARLIVAEHGLLDMWRHTPSGIGRAHV